MKPGYISLFEAKELVPLYEKIFSRLKACDLCPHKCGVDRLNNQKGICRSGRYARVNSVFLHFGEEPEIVGRNGSGTIFFANCNLRCIYCQNYTLSHYGEGEDVSSDVLAKMMVSLQDKGAENINFVTPTHFLPQIIEALIKAVEQGLKIPLVYNCGGYDDVGVLRDVKGIFDIYMPDIKYANNELSKKYSGVNDYWDVVKMAVREMYFQVGDLKIKDRVAYKGLLVRHLVLPDNIDNSLAVLDFVRNEISVHTYINIMDQYYPCYEAYRFAELGRRITPQEYRIVLDYAKRLGLYRGFSA